MEEPMTGEQLEYEAAELFGDALKDIARTTSEATTDPIEVEMCGVPIEYENSSLRKDTWDEWEPVLQAWMPRFEEAGYLDKLRAIRIGNGHLQSSGSAGQYIHEQQVVAFPQNPSYAGQPWLVGETKEYALIHEVTHHAHIRDLFGKPASKVSLLELNLRQTGLGFAGKAEIFHDEVSQYAASNYLEAVAETCAGLTLGREYPERVLDAYEHLKGPEPIR